MWSVRAINSFIFFEVKLKSILICPKCAFDNGGEMWQRLPVAMWNHRRTKDIGFQIGQGNGFIHNSLLNMKS